MLTHRHIETAAGLMQVFAFGPDPVASHLRTLQMPMSGIALISSRSSPMSTMKQSMFVILILLCALVPATTPSAAQTVTGTVSGTIVDPSGAVISGATVTLLNERTGDARKAITSDEGRFVFSAVQPEIYTLKVTMQGFESLEQKRIVLSA